ncbi:glycosyl transferase family 2 [Mangrovibacter plantisponsor]|uniref:Glycosyltransferase involved in cell wall biosynthesis n=1 Tax=Mangrovibacter plantisponsor TaxID=451513 RepID=A0A317Q6B5_9ENTR|nr:glycosyl transferase family 2 [Mangrovibacter plantisponsor]PWW11555.1 hypothetical protein DES37_102161 [Mangrovibacter plantisponsor]
MKSEAFVSVVIKIKEKSDSYIEQISLLNSYLDDYYSDYEILIIVCELNLLDTETEDYLLNELSCMRIIQLSSNQNEEIASAVGIENAIGDFVVLFNINTDPVQIISEAINSCRNGSDVIIGITESFENIRYYISRKIFSKVLSAIDYKIPEKSTDFRCLSRRSVNALTRTGRFHHKLTMRIQKLGYPVNTIIYKPLIDNDGKNLYQSFRKLIYLIVFNSSRPLRWMSILGVTGSLSSFIFATYSVLIHFIDGHVVEGWTTTILFMSLLFTFMFIILTFFGEYLARLLDENSRQFDYYVVYEKNSTIMLNVDRLNVLNEAVSDEVNNVQTGRKK